MDAADDSPPSVKRPRLVGPPDSVLPSIRRSSRLGCTTTVFSSTPAGATFINMTSVAGSVSTGPIQLPLCPPPSAAADHCDSPAAACFSVIDMKVAAGALYKLDRGRSASITPGTVVSTEVQVIRSHALLQQETHQLSAAQRQANQENTQTARSYKRHVASFFKFWTEDQQRRARNDPAYVSVPALPITTTKAALFLHHERERPKRKRNATEEEEGSTCGRSHIAQVISALENWRLMHAHEYPDEREVQTSFRQDMRISSIEDSAKRHEPERIASAQTLKAIGGTADTYTIEDVRRCSLYHFNGQNGVQRTSVAHRDRAMLLLGVETAFRGDSSRNVLMSDLFVSDIPLSDVAPGFRVPMLGIMAYNAKHNQYGRLDEHGVLRHCDVELCAVGAVAFHLFTVFHVVGLKPTPEWFVPDFKNPNYGKYGHRPWHDYYLFFGNTNPEGAMTYTNHRDRVKVMHKDNGIEITKVTHASRAFAAQNCRLNGASESGTKALGGWNDGSGTYRQCYERSQPLDALLAAAGHNARKPESYTLPRGQLEPPDELVQQVFPWVDEHLQMLEERVAKNVLCQDFSLRHFLRLLKWLRVVLLQDAAVLFTRYPGAPVWKYAPFTSVTFADYASKAGPTLQLVEAETTAVLHNLPQNVADTLRGITAHSLVQHRNEFSNMHSVLSSVQSMMHNMEHAYHNNTRGGRKGRTASLQCTISTPSTLTVSTKTAAANSTDVLPPLPTVSPLPTPHTPSMPPPSPAHYTMALSTSDAYKKFSIPAADNSRAAKESAAVAELGQAKFDMHRPWEWIESTKELLPTYRYQVAPTVADIWLEWADGRNGYMSVRTLNERWGTRWRRADASLRQETVRRTRVIKLLNDLIAKPKWDVALALRFLAATYPITAKPKKARSFMDSLAGAKGSMLHQEIIAASATYC